MNRRNFFEILAAALPSARLWAAGVSPDLKITCIETVYWESRDEVPWWPHWTWVRLHTNEGIFGLGETYPRGDPEAAMFHSAAARALLGKHPGDIERIWRDLYVAFDYQITGGTEMRILSAIDLALWDLLGKTLGVPVYRLIGGRANPRVRLYNTCFPYKYNFLSEPDRIMSEVMEQHGIRAIKVWPFDGAARRNSGQFVTVDDIDQGLAPIRKLRDVFGEKIEILVEFHSLWNLPAAERIARAIEPYKPMWLEDMLLPGNFPQYRQLAESSSIGLAIGERMAGKMNFQALLESRAARYIMFDVCWCGGLTEARKIAAMADAMQLPFAPHTAGGPLLFYASTHLSTALTNCWIQESCQRFYERDWPAMLIDPLKPRDGTIEAPDQPGFGMNIKPDVWTDQRAIRQVSES